MMRSRGLGMDTSAPNAPWWTFPTPLGPPKIQQVYGACYLEMHAPDGTIWHQPCPCGIRWPWSTGKQYSDPDADPRFNEH